MSQAIKSLLQQLSRAAFRSFAEKYAEERNNHKQIQAETKLIEAQKREEFVAKVNYYNWYSVFYFSLSPRIKKVILSTVFLDYLLLLVPFQLLLLSEEMIYTLRQAGEYLLIGLALIVIFLDRQNGRRLGIPQKAYKYVLILILLLVLGFGAWDIFSSAEQSLFPILFQVFFISVAAVPIIQAIRSAKPNGAHLQTNNLFAILKFIAPLVALRSLHLFYFMTILLAQIGPEKLVIFTFLTLISMFQVKPLKLGTKVLVQ